MESSISSKKLTKTRRILVKTTSLVHFLEEFSAWQFAFEINWPLVCFAASKSDSLVFPFKWNIGASDTSVFQLLNDIFLVSEILLGHEHYVQKMGDGPTGQMLTNDQQILVILSCLITTVLSFIFFRLERQQTMISTRKKYLMC